MRDQRALLRHRVALVQVATSLRNHVHAVLADRGIRLEQRLWSASGRAWLAGLTLPPVARAIIDDRLALIDALDPIVARLDRDLRARAKPDPPSPRSWPCPRSVDHRDDAGGPDRRHHPLPIGPQAVCLGGADPQMRNSDRTLRHGHTTKQGSAAVRRVLTQAAQRAKTQPPFARFYAEYAHHRGRQIATVAVARKLPARSFHILNQVHATTTTSAEGQPAGCARQSARPATRPSP